VRLFRTRGTNPERLRYREHRHRQRAACGIENIVTVNVLEDAEVRQGIKEFSNWPTIPQLYIKGEFIGGSDIMTEMYESGELQNLLKA
jgi:monothiol glutaredoxin